MKLKSKFNLTYSSQMPHDIVLTCSGFIFLMKHDFAVEVFCSKSSCLEMLFLQLAQRKSRRYDSLERRSYGKAKIEKKYFVTCRPVSFRHDSTKGKSKKPKTQRVNDCVTLLVTVSVINK